MIHFELSIFLLALLRIPRVQANNKENILDPRRNMRRFTMTPNSRNPMKAQTPPVKSAPFPRHSIITEEAKRKDARSIREKGHIQQCAESVFMFLSENGYDGQISQKLLYNPSSKDFQSIFRFMYSFIDKDFEFSPKFEDDVVSIIKGLKYPHCGEITKSQLIAITPHTWPVILSMCSWLVEVISYSTLLLEEDFSGGTIEDLFFEYVCSGYLRFMEGNEDDAALEEELERKVADIHTKMFDEIDKKSEHLAEIEARTLEVKDIFDAREKLEEKKRDLVEDLNMLISSEKQLEGKKIKYLNVMSKLNEEFYDVEKEIDELRNHENELKEQISRQKINPDDIKEMNVEKMELFTELERIRHEKEGLMKVIGEQEKNLQDGAEEVEKFFFDFRNIREEFSLKIDIRGEDARSGDVKVFNDADGVKDLEEGISNVIKDLKEELSSKREVLVAVEMNRNMLLEAKTEREGACEDLENKFKHCNEKLVTTGKLYLEKKEIYENEQRKSKAEMEILESELLKLNLESNTSLLTSEQKLQKARISLDRMLNLISLEREEISKTAFNFYNSAVDIIAEIRCQVEEFKELLNS